MKVLALLAMATVVTAEVTFTDKAMKCYCYSHGILRNIEHTSIACQKRAGQGVQGIRRKGYCYIDEDEVDLFKDICEYKGSCKKNKKYRPVRTEQ
ncbi:hypothetical protein CTA2_7584 [Colletotrichum tanaceti]|nr:hypothetical protein CTA2_7584 [Colletotrichum tanaceti]